MSFAKIVLTARPDSHVFEDRHIPLPLNEPAKIGRSVAKVKPASSNGVFDCKVLSRNHAVIWYENGRFYVQDTKSSNGTYVNSQRLSRANEESTPYEIFTSDVIQFGVEIVESTKKITHGCVIASVQLFLPDGVEAREFRVAMPQTGDESMANRGAFMGTDGQRSGVPQLGGALTGMNGLTQIHAHEVYALASCLSEALMRENALDTKLRTLDAALNAALQSTDVSWKALLDEERLVSKLDAVQQQLSVYAALSNAMEADEAEWKRHKTALDDDSDSTGDGKPEAKGDEDDGLVHSDGHKRADSESERVKHSRVEQLAIELRDQLVTMHAERAAYEDSARLALRDVLEQKETASRQCMEAERRAMQLDVESRAASERIESLQKQLEALAKSAEERDDEIRKREARFRDEERERESEMTALRRDRERLEQLTLSFRAGTGTGTYKINEGSLLEALRRFGDPQEGSRLDELAKLGIDSANLKMAESGLQRMNDSYSEREKQFEVDEELPETEVDTETEQIALHRISEELSRILERCRNAISEQNSSAAAQAESHTADQHETAHAAAEAECFGEKEADSDLACIDDAIDEMFKLDSFDSSLTEDSNSADITQKLTDSTTTINTLTDQEHSEASATSDHYEDKQATVQNLIESGDNEGECKSDKLDNHMCSVQYETIESLKAAFDEIVDFWKKRDIVRRNERARNAERARMMNALKDELRATLQRLDDRSNHVEALEAELEKCKQESNALSMRLFEVERNAADELHTAQVQFDLERETSLRLEGECDALRRQVGELETVKTKEVPDLDDKTTETSSETRPAETQTLAECAALREQCEQLRRRIAQIEAEVSTYREDNERLQAANEALSKSAAAKETFSEAQVRDKTAELEVTSLDASAFERVRELEAANAEFEREIESVRSRARQISGFAMLPVLLVVFAIMVRLCLWLSGVASDT